MPAARKKAKKKAAWGGYRRGAGRIPLPPGQRRVSISVTIPEWMVEAIGRECVAAGVSRSAVIERYLAKIKR